MWRRNRIDFRRDVEQEHEPVRISFVAGFGHDAGEMGLSWRDVKAEFFSGFTAGAGVRRFAVTGVKFTAGWTPQAEVWFLGAAHEKDLVARVEAIEKGRNFVNERHSRTNVTIMSKRQSKEAASRTHSRTLARVLQPQMLPQVGGLEAEVDVEGAEFAVAGADFVETHFVDDFF
jgi:hypothetical protein